MNSGKQELINLLKFIVSSHQEAGGNQNLALGGPKFLLVSVEQIMNGGYFAFEQMGGGWYSII